MKKVILLLFYCFSNISHSQNVNIPDANFKSALLSNTSINTNADGEIQVSEAIAYSGAISVSNKNISDLAGIEAFTSITGLDCSSNQLTTLNVSSNPLLSTLGCNNNQLASLNISANTGLVNLVCGFNQLNGLSLSSNTALTSVDCGNNNITALNLSANTALVTLSCYNNQLTALNLTGLNDLKYVNCQQNQLGGLDVSGNTSVKEVRCYNNNLTTLNIKNGNNANFTGFFATNNPGLVCIEVDNAAYMNATWPGSKDASASYNENCLAGVAEIGKNAGVFSVYPSPSSGIVTIDHSSKEEVKVQVYDILGNCIWKKDQKVKEIKIDLGFAPKGVYFLEMESAGKKTVKRLILE